VENVPDSETTNSATGFHFGPGEGRLLRVLNSRLEIKVGEEAGLSLGMFHSTFPSGTGMPLLHLHRNHTEIFYVLEGELQFQLGDEEIHPRAGSTIVVPPRTPHCFRNAGSGDVRWLVIGSPAATITAIEEAGALPPGDIDAMAALFERYDSVLLERRPHWGS
jgi:mannose-6-phosphate isomerase-like protein (cupin superfamily)